MTDSAPAGRSQGKTVLFVEDSPDDVDLTLRSFRKNNFAHALIVVRDGQEALQYVFGEGAYAGANAKPTPDLVLLDLNLPKVNGLDVLKRIRADENFQTLPVIVLSASTDERDRLATEALGANLFLRKPEGMADLNYVVSRVNDLLNAGDAAPTVSHIIL